MQGSTVGLAQGVEAAGVLLQSGAVTLVSWWKPLLIAAPFVGWAWLISKVFDKHCARFFLPREQWNLAHLAAGTLALAVAVLMPLESPFAILASLAAVVLILGADIAIFVMKANADERVPEKFKLRVKFGDAKAKAAREAAKLAGQAELVIRSPDKSVMPVPNKDTPDYGVRVAAEALLINAITSRATQADLAPTGKDNAYGTTLLVDSVRQAGQTMPGPDAIKVIDFWKSAAKLDVNDRRRKLVGDLQFERGQEKKNLRIMSSGTQGGMRLTLLIDPEKQVRRKPEDLGLLEGQVAELNSIVELEKGVVLLSAPPDNGRTTLLYTIMKMHDAYTRNMQTIELEIQDQLEGIKQNKWDPQAEGPDHATLVRTILRRDPDVVGVAELLDAATAKEIAKAEHDRTRVYTTLAVDGTVAMLQQWMKGVGDAELGAKVLQGLVSGKLLRKLCIECRQEYQPSPDVLKRAGLPADKVQKLYKKGGQVLIKNKPEVCPTCKGIGFFGVTGVMEVYKLGDAEREKIKAGDWNGLRVELRKKQLPSLQQVALRRAMEGVTSLEEVVRITTEGKAEAPAAKAPAPAAPAAPAKA
ncbi:MAG: ATPase, T2SS/T4P/T4SS family [Planctomycetota bacterium]|nr:ATPase, T2SS/T4P/T4SS family [Planctomycetota bacterium]